MFNRIILMGRLTKDPELKTTQSGITMCRFSIAVDRAYSKGQEKQTDFFDITAWRQTAEFVSKYFSKGKCILIEGKLQNNNYTDQNGVKQYRNAIIADNVAFCGDKSGGQQNGQAPPAQQPYQNQYQQPQQGYAQNQGYQQPYQNYAPPQYQQGYSQPQQNYAPAQNQPPQGYQQNHQPPPAVGDLSDYEMILNDGEVPF
jgi:single-strand DNA-binding protein